jgi:hypothetical protein
MSTSNLPVSRAAAANALHRSPTGPWAPTWKPRSGAAVTGSFDRTDGAERPCCAQTPALPAPDGPPRSLPGFALVEWRLDGA